MKYLCPHDICTGCGACVNICSQDAISFSISPDGFTYPSINNAKCIECGICEKSCPQLNPIRIEKIRPHAFALIGYEDRKTSSSGGAFSVFAKYVLARNGLVFGASFYKRKETGEYTSQFPSLSHIIIESITDLKYLRGSKYIQSEIGDSYKIAKNVLKTGRIVLFTGTPCQIAGLYAFLGKKKFNNLITIDLVCHGVPNQKVFDTYLRKLKRSPRFSTGDGNIKEFRFRKLDSWSIVPAVKFAKAKWKVLEQEDNAYMNAFFKLSIFRESCYKCSYSNMDRVGTFTIADYWGIGKSGIPFKKDVSTGVSLVIDNQGQMDSMIDELRTMAYIEERPLEEGRLYNHNLNEPSKRPDERDTAVLDLLDEKMTLLQYAQKYHLLDGKLKHFLKHTFKKLIYMFRLYNIYKTISFKFGKGS